MPLKEDSVRHERADQFLENPLDFFGGSYTAMHSIPRSRLEGLQRDSLSMRFTEQRARIPMVAKLADRQGIEAVEELESVAPMLFEHTMYKSYPLVLLERQQFDRMTSWLDKLTAVDLSGVEASSCDSIDAWLETLQATTQVDPAYSSGTSGTMTFFPWSQRDLEMRALSHRITDLQSFGDASVIDADERIHFVGAPSRHRGRHYNGDATTAGDDSYLHLSSSSWPSADLLWLGARLRLAAVRGDVTRVEVPESLLTRRAELEAQNQEVQRARALWLESVEGLQGQKVLWLVFAHELHEIAQTRLERGEHWSFADGSTAMMAGGTKGQDLPANWRETLARFTNLRLMPGYGMTELSCVHTMCEFGRYHVQPWVIQLVLDEETSQLLPRAGVQRGRCAFFDLMPRDHWGGVITGDEVEVDYDTPCRCGATTVHLGPDIARLSDKRGGSDKITCAATPQAHAEAMEFLVGYQ
jgi:hypothetical protein